MRFAAACLTLLALTAGCTSVNNLFNRLAPGSSAQPVAPDEFMQRQSTADKSETLSGDSQLTVAPAPAASATPANKPATIDSAVASVVQNPTPVAATQLATPELVSTTEPTLASGQYLPLGGVVADVNGTPIYINKVLQLVWPILHNDARTMDVDHFQLAARDEIQRQILVLEGDELFYAAAEHGLDKDSIKLVADLTTAYRQHLITLAGGSLELARRKAIDNGDDFDTLVADQHRRYMIELYQSRKYSPLIEPSAQDMRIYYRENADKLFTDHDEAVFDLIKIDPSLLGGASAAADHKLAFDKAKEAHDRAAANADFATLFAEYNNDPGLKALTNGTGNMGSMQRGSFNVKEVEDAVWALQPGQVTDVLEVDGILYVAKLESRKEGRVRRFEDEEVQAEIAAAIRKVRYTRYHDADEQRLLDESIRHVYPEMFDTAADMAMQSYRTWNEK
jgi:hypothetical protein